MEYYCFVGLLPQLKIVIVQWHRSYSLPHYLCLEAASLLPTYVIKALQLVLGVNRVWSAPGLDLSGNYPCESTHQRSVNQQFTLHLPFAASSGIPLFPEYFY